MRDLHIVTTSNFPSEAASAVAKTTPPVLMTSAAASGVDLEQWMYAATILWIVLQAVYLIYKTIKERDK